MTAMDESGNGEEEEEEEERVFRNGDIYVGTWRCKQPHGRGKYVWSDGSMYEGGWERGKKSGKGKMSWPSGATYEGELRGGNIHGAGTFTAADGNTYSGQWEMNEKSGLGTKSYGNGDVYQGSWRRDVAHGAGRYTWSNGNEYVGEWKSGVMSGRGRMMWSDGETYDGEWQDGKPHGYGVYTWRDGSSYEGTWTKGCRGEKGIGAAETAAAAAAKAAHRHDDDDDGGMRWSSSSLSPSSSSSSCYFSSSSFDGSGDGDGDGDGDGNGAADAAPAVDDDDDDDGDDGAAADAGSTDVDSDPQSCRSMASLDMSVCFSESVVETDLHSWSSTALPSMMKENGLLSLNTSSSSSPSNYSELQLQLHRQHDLMLNLQMGIRYTVGKITPEPHRDICPFSDFGPKARIRMAFPKQGSHLTPPHHHSTDFKWKDYCPVVFRHLREMFKIDTADYMLSICGNSGLRELSSPGKSGSVFYISHDDRFMIKTMRKAEVKMLLAMLPNYFNHVQTYENTLITKFFGLHRIKPAGGPKVRFVVMGNMFCTELRIHRRFDLKGSTQGRSADKLDQDENTTLKDLDLDFVFKLQPSWREALLRQIEYDCRFLESQNIMDYSFLLGVHFQAPQSPAILSRKPGLFLVAHEPEADMIQPGSHVRGSPLKAAADEEEIDLLLPGTARLRVQLGVNMPARAVSKKGGEVSGGEALDVVLYFGMIDILQEYDMGKKLEHAFKSLQFDAFSISAVDPALYSRRFQDFIRNTFP